MSKKQEVIENDFMNELVEIMSASKNYSKLTYVQVIGCLDTIKFQLLKEDELRNSYEDS